MFSNSGRPAEFEPADTTLSAASARIGRDHRGAVCGSDEADASTQTRIYIVQTQLLIAEALRLLLEKEPDFVVVGTQTDLAGIEQNVRATEVDVLVLDAVLDVARLSAIRRAIDVSPKVIVTAATSDLLAPSIAAGAVGYLTGAFLYSDLVQMIRHVSAGWIALSPDQLATLMSGATLSPPTAADVDACKHLTARERTALQVLATGASVNETARRLHISKNTVRAHIKNVMHKLNVRSKLAAVIMALRAGIIDEPDE